MSHTAQAALGAGLVLVVNSVAQEQRAVML